MLSPRNNVLQTDFSGSTVEVGLASTTDDLLTTRVVPAKAGTQALSTLRLDCRSDGQGIGHFQRWEAREVPIGGP
jgi:hypothetical protein